jgi:hypothetical protein
MVHFMPNRRNHVRPNASALTDADARHLLAAGLIRACHTHGPSRVALTTGCDEKTIRRARDEESTLGLACAFNLLLVDPHALDELLAALGYMAVPLVPQAGDIIPAAGAAIHKIGQNRTAQSEGGSHETDREMIASEPENDALLAACLERRAAIVAAKRRRAA